MSNRAKTASRISLARLRAAALPVALGALRLRFLVLDSPSTSAFASASWTTSGNGTFVSLSAVSNSDHGRDLQVSDRATTKCV
jgi:hypothetical protein